MRMWRKNRDKKYIKTEYFQDQPGVKALNALYKEKYGKDEMAQWKKKFGWYDLGKGEETVLLVNPSVAFKRKVAAKKKGLKYKRISLPLLFPRNLLKE